MVRMNPVDDTYSGDIGDDLETAFTQVMEEQERLSLLKSLTKKGACTRDVLSFMKNQADTKTVFKELDEVIARRAMNLKVKDCKAVLITKKHKKTVTIKQCHEAIGKKGYKLRKAIKKVKQNLVESRKNRQSKNERKINHLQKQIEQLKEKYKSCKDVGFNPTKVPDRLIEFKDLCIFKTPRDLPAKQVPVGPFLCNPHIKLDENEKKLLSRDPKYSTNTHCNKVTFNMELERGLGKHRYNEHGKKVMKKKDRTQIFIAVDPDGKNLYTDDLTGPKPENMKNKLQEIWKKESHRYTFDPFENTLSFVQRRPTDYKLNTRVVLPKALDCDSEFACEIRKRAYQEAFREYEQKITKSSGKKI